MFKYIKQIPEGYSLGNYRGKKYGISKKLFNKGKSIKIYAEELGGNDFISLNFYRTANEDLLKPCEMPERKVVQFLKKCKILKQRENE